jgi:glucokinase
MGKKSKASDLYVGVDVGGTKIFAALVRRSGFVLARKRCSTPRNASAKDVVAALAELIGELLAKGGVGAEELAALGLSIPGVVDPDAGKVVFTPNMNLTGLDAVAAFREYVDVPVALGNDVDMGTLGETWLGSARDASSAVGMFVGTGIGGGVVIDGKLHRGARGAAGEVGHMIVQRGGPKCGCGYHGCFEALASRTAMERDIRSAIASGRKSVVPDLLENPDDLIRSSTLRRALAAGDKVVAKVMQNASEVIGEACLTIQHLLDPDVIVMGGGVVEACGDFMLPIISVVVESDPLSGMGRTGTVIESALGDDAVALGAAALAQRFAGIDPFEKAEGVEKAYPTIEKTDSGAVIADKKVKVDTYVRVDGKVRKVKEGEADGGGIGPDLLKKICNGGPPVLFVGASKGADVDITPEGQALLERRRIKLKTLLIGKAVRAYSEAKGRKAIYLRVSA